MREGHDTSGLSGRVLESFSTFLTKNGNPTLLVVDNHARRWSRGAHEVKPKDDDDGGATSKVLPFDVSGEEGGKGVLAEMTSLWLR